MNNNFLNNNDEDSRHMSAHHQDFDVMNSMNLGLDDTQNKIKGLSRVKSNESVGLKNILSQNFHNKFGGAGMNPHGMPGIGISHIEGQMEHQEGHDSAIRTVHDRIEELTNVNKGSQPGSDVGFEESIVRSKEISNLDELSELNKRKSERIMRNNSDQGKMRSMSQFGRPRENMAESDGLNLKIPDTSIHFNIDSKIERLNKYNHNHQFETNASQNINNSFDPSLFQSKLSAAPEQSSNPINDLSMSMQNLIRRTTNEKTEEEEPNPLNMTKGIEDILGKNRGGESAHDSRKEETQNINLADESYNVLIGYEGHDFDSAKKNHETPQREHSANSFDVKLSEGENEWDGENRSQDDGMGVNVDMDFSMDFQDAKPNIETPSEKNDQSEHSGKSQENSFEIDGMGEEEDEEGVEGYGTKVGKSSLDETLRPSDAFNNSRERNDIVKEIGKKREDELSISRTDENPNSRPMLTTQEDIDISEDELVQSNSAVSIQSKNLESESQRELASTILDYVTNENVTRESTNKEKSNFDLLLKKDKKINEIKEDDETNLDEEETSENEDSVKSDKNEGNENGLTTENNDSKEDNEPSIQTVDTTNDIIFKRNHSQQNPSFMTDKMDDCSTVAGTVVAESFQKKSQSEKKLVNLKNKFKKKKNPDSSKKRGENADVIKRNKSKTNKKHDTEKNRKKNTTNKNSKNQVKNNLYHRIKSKFLKKSNFKKTTTRENPKNQNQTITCFLHQINQNV
jgi:hypothetical protein